VDEKDFQRKADAAFDDLKRRLLTVGDEHGFDVEGESGKLEVIFEEPKKPNSSSPQHSRPRNLDLRPLHQFQARLVRCQNTFVSEKPAKTFSKS